MKRVTRIGASILLACVLLLQVPSFGAEKTMNETAQEVLDRFSKYDVQWIGEWETKKSNVPEYLGEGIFKKLQSNGELHLIDAAGNLLNNLGTGKDWTFEQFTDGVCKFRDMVSYNYGLINNKGKVILEPTATLINEFSEGLCAIRDAKADAWGYINKEGKVVIPPKFTWAEEFINGAALVSSGYTGTGYINTKGEFLVPPEYDWLSSYNELIAVLKVVEDDEGMRQCYGFVDKNGKALTGNDFAWASELSKDGLACAVNDDGYGYVDKTGKTVIPFQYNFAGHFSEGLAFVCNAEGKFGYIDKTGKTVIPFIFDDARAFSEGLAAVSTKRPESGKERLYGYINTKGELVIPEKFENAGMFKNGIALYGKYSPQSFGMIDKTGKVLAENKQSDELVNQDGLVKYRLHNYFRSPLADRYGYIDKNGNDMGADAVYTELGDYKEGLAAYTKELSEVPFQNRIRGYVDKNFNSILEDKDLVYVGDFSNGVAGITISAKQGNETWYRTGLLKSPYAATKAIPTPSKIIVNGKPVSIDAYGINGNNYFKLRDLAKLFSGTDKQFEVTWDGQKKAINLVSGKPYTAVGGELAIGDGKEKLCTLNLSKVYRDGQEVSLKAYTINGNNFFKLRDVLKTFNIGVTWDPVTSTIVIDTNTEYVD